MKAVLMAGGFGKRLHPLTVNIPKPLIPLCGVPIMQHVIGLLKKHSIDDIVVLLHHQPNLIKKYFGDGSKFGVKLTYVEAGEDYGTAGAVKFAQQHLDEQFIVISADLITNIDLGSIIKFHNKKKAEATVTLTRVPNPLEYGIVILNEDGAINHFLEKPSWSEVFSDTINTGIYIIEPKVLKYIPEEKVFDFSMDLFPKMLREEKKLFGCVQEGYWKDIGNIAEYRSANLDSLSSKIDLCSENIDPTNNSIIGENSVVEKGAKLSRTIIGKKCSIEAGADISDCVIWDNVKISRDCELTGAVIADGCVLNENVVLEDGSVVSSNCIIGKNVKVRKNIRVWPGRIIEDGSTVNSSMIVRQRWTKALFGAYGITGICNVDITPEFAAKLGSAFGASLGGKGNSITSSMDGHKASRMISRGLISGLLSAGINVSNLETVPSPINRYELKALRSKGGIHVRKSPFDPDVVDIKFFDSDGMDLSPLKEKAIEKMFWAEDFMRAGMEEVGDLTFPFYRVAEGYKEGLLNFANPDRIREQNFKIIIDYAYGSASSIFPSILGAIGCETVAINAYIDETKFTKTNDEFNKSLKQLSKIVTTLKANVGIMFDTGAEKIFLVDEEGRVLDGDSLLSLITYLVVNDGSAKRIAVPVTASSVIEDIASKKGVQVIRTRTNLRAMMETSAQEDVGFFGEGLGGFIYPGFQPSFDAMLSTTKFLDLLSASQEPISKIVDSLPKKQLLKDKVPCPNELKGMVLRSLLDSEKEGKASLFDGVKITFGKNWVFINGHQDKQEMQVFSESDDINQAKQLLSIYKEKIKTLVSKQLLKQ